MPKKPRKELTSQQKEEAEQLLKLWKKRDPKISQGDFGAEHGIGEQAVVWQYLHGWIPLNLRVAIKFAKGLGCEVVEFSPILALELLQNKPSATGDAIALIKIYGLLSREGKANLLDNANWLHNKEHSTKKIISRVVDGPALETIETNNLPKKRPKKP